MLAKNSLRAFTIISVLLLLALGPTRAQSIAQPQVETRTFPETGKTVRGKFLDYWNSHGGLMQQGYPISDEMQERSDTDGKVYRVQYFERAVFELHPENQPPHDVLLQLLGVFYYERKYVSGTPDQVPNTSRNSRLFNQTGKRVGGIFLDYWNTHGGLSQQGLPITDEFREISDLDGNSYLVQYFERAVFEYHPENPSAYNVLLAQLGTFRYQSKYLASTPEGPAQGQQSPTASRATATLAATETPQESRRERPTKVPPKATNTPGIPGPIKTITAIPTNTLGIPGPIETVTPRPTNTPVVPSRVLGLN